MNSAIRLAALLCLWSVLAFAGSWSGYLVDSKCFDIEQRNVNPTDTETSVDRDINQEIRYCSAKAKTKSFAVVQKDGLEFKLDSAGNDQAIGLVHQAGKKPLFLVVVTGEMNKETINVDSISIEEPRVTAH